MNGLYIYFFENSLSHVLVLFLKSQQKFENKYKMSQKVNINQGKVRKAVRFCYL